MATAPVVQAKTVTVAKGIPCVPAHALLCLIAVHPLLTRLVPTNLNIVLTAITTVYVGCQRSVKAHPPVDSMSNKDAMRFPVIGSAVLLSLFLLFKFLPKELVNAVLTAYFVILGTFAITATLLPFLEAPFSDAVQQKGYGIKGLRIPLILKEPTDFAVTVPELIGGACSLLFCCWYYASKHWLANNVLGLCFSIQGIEHLSLGSIQTGIILLLGLFFYDIFWVFCTPVMVSVAKNFEAPIKLLFPRAVDEVLGKVPFSMLGLGDIVIPGIFVALVLRYDVKNKFATNHFRSAFFGYTTGLAATILVMNVFNAAQPALLYIVPAVLGAVFLHAAATNTVKSLYAFNESPAKDDEKEGPEGQKGSHSEPKKALDSTVASGATVKKTS